MSQAFPFEKFKNGTFFQVHAKDGARIANRSFQIFDKDANKELSLREVKGMMKTIYKGIIPNKNFNDNDTKGRQVKQKNKILYYQQKDILQIRLNKVHQIIRMHILNFLSQQTERLAMQKIQDNYKNNMRNQQQKDLEMNSQKNKSVVAKNYSRDIIKTKMKNQNMMKFRVFLKRYIENQILQVKRIKQMALTYEDYQK